MIAEIESASAPPKRALCVYLPATRMSILDPRLETEPALGHCPCSDMLVLFVHNYPIAMIPGTCLDCISLNIRLSELRHRPPRQA